MALRVQARTAFSLFLSRLLEEFVRDWADTAGAFSFGFVCSALMSPLAGRVMDRQGPRVVIAGGALMMTSGLLLATRVSSVSELYLSLGLLVGAGANLMSYSAQSHYLPNGFVRKRGLAISLAFSGVGVGAIKLLPRLQTVIMESGWREA
jgi:MFS family permease